MFLSEPLNFPQSKLKSSTKDVAPITSSSNPARPSVKIVARSTLIDLQDVVSSNAFS